MALNLSLASFVIIALSVIALILGTILLLNLTIFSQDVVETDLPSPFIEGTISSNTRIDVQVTPSTSQEGTVFAIVADTWPPTDSQDLQVVIENQGKEIPLTLFDDVVQLGVSADLSDFRFNDPEDYLFSVGFSASGLVTKLWK